MDWEALYLSLPRPLQTVALNLEGWRIDRRRYAHPYDTLEAEVVARRTLTDTALRQYQAIRMSTQMLAACNSPFWKRRFAKYGVIADSEDPFVELEKMPVLTKDEVKTSALEILNPGFQASRLGSRHTSGTTGSGLVFWETRDCERETWATWWRYRYWHGLTKRTWCGYFGGRSIVSLEQKSPPFWRTNFSGRQLMFSAYHLSGATAGYYLHAIAEAGITWLHGYPSMIALLAKHQQDLKVELSVRTISFGAETLTEAQREVVLIAFPGVQLIQHYGQAEGVANISQCPDGGLHVDEDFSFVEFVPLNDQQNQFKIIGSNWNNPAFPLFRYDTGDVATLANSPCTCGVKWRTVAQIDGRIEDYIKLPSGAKIGRLDHIFKDMTNINEAQIRQGKDGRVTFSVVRGMHFTQDDQVALLMEARKRLGGDVEIKVEYVAKLPRTKAGKLRLVVRNE